MSTHRKYIQIEITTICNFGCFYCAGRRMPQRHMQLAAFDAILASLHGTKGSKVSLQGEGEPTLHPDFMLMAEKVQQNGHIPYTIINGSHIEAEALEKLFPEIGVSLDTLDAAEAERIGRRNLPLVLDGIERLVRTMKPERIIIHTVNYGQPMDELDRFLKFHNLHRRVIQPLQMKDDYRCGYPDFSTGKGKWAYRFYCRYLEQSPMRYFDVTGLELPCRYIKDTSKFTSVRHLQENMRKKMVPPCCTGCREIVVRQQ